MPVPLLHHPKSLVRNRALHILAANAQWDDNNRFDTMFDDYLAHITDDKPITARECIKALVQAGRAKPQYIPRILSFFHSADLLKCSKSQDFIERGCDAWRIHISSILSQPLLSGNYDIFTEILLALMSEISDNYEYMRR